MRITWLGRACFHITISDGTQIVMDPYSGGMGFPPLELDADIVSVSHAHGDHSNIGAITGEYKLLDTSGAYNASGVSVRGIDTFHDDSEGSKRGNNVIFVYTLDGLNVCHCGDLGHVPTDAQRDKIGHVDILIIPVGGYYTLPLDEVVETIKLLNPSVTIPMHCRVHPEEEFIAPVDDFLAAISEHETLSANYMDISSSNIGAFMPVVAITAQ